MCSPEVVSAQQALEAAPEDRVPEVLTELDRLIPGAVPVAEIRSLGCPQVEAQAFLRTRCEPR